MGLKERFRAGLVTRAEAIAEAQSWCLYDDSLQTLYAYDRFMSWIVKRKNPKNEVKHGRKKS
jgi:hypothetical protein